MEHGTRQLTAAQWTSANPILGPGAEGVESDTLGRKVGDGSTAWTSLPYQVPPLLAALSGIIPGTGYFQGASGVTTSATLGNGTLRVCPFYLTAKKTVTEMFFDLITAGDAASLLATGIWADTGAGMPGALVLTGPTFSTGSGNAGNVSTGGTGGVYQGAVSQALNPGVYWIGGAVQGVTVTQPTIRIGVFMPNFCAPSSTLPVAASGALSVNQSGVTGALPSTFAPAGVSPNAPARVGFKLALAMSLVA